MKYCPRCKSRLFPIDEDYIREHGKCSYCCTYPAVKRYMNMVKEGDKKRDSEKKESS